MKKFNKKGFTIVELVVVIAVIAILAAVLIPTFSNFVDKANESKAMQEAQAAYDVWYLKEVEKTDFDASKVDACITCNGYHFDVVDGQFNPKAVDTTGHTALANTGSVTNGVLTLNITYGA